LPFDASLPLPGSTGTVTLPLAEYNHLVELATSKPKTPEGAPLPFVLSRAAFKLLQLDEQVRFLKPGARVVDLGAAPGGWTQVAVERVKGGVVVGIDVTPVEPIAGATVLAKDFYDDDAPDALRALLGGPADVVLSDMAAPAIGDPQVDHMRIMALAETAHDFARQVLEQGGTFVAKVLRGGTERTLLDQLKRDFVKVRHIKPAASRADSAEMYVVGTGFRG